MCQELAAYVEAVCEIAKRLAFEHVNNRMDEIVPPEWQQARDHLFRVALQTLVDTPMERLDLDEVTIAMRRFHASMKAIQFLRTYASAEEIEFMPTHEPHHRMSPWARDVQEFIYTASRHYVELRDDWATPNVQRPCTYNEHMVLLRCQLAHADPNSEEEMGVLMKEVVHDDLDIMIYAWSVRLFDKTIDDAERLGGLGAYASLELERDEVPVYASLPADLRLYAGKTVQSKLEWLLTAARQSPGFEATGRAVEAFRLRLQRARVSRLQMSQVSQAFSNYVHAACELARMLVAQFALNRMDEGVPLGVSATQKTLFRAVMEHLTNETLLTIGPGVLVHDMRRWGACRSAVYFVWAHAPNVTNQWRKEAEKFVFKCDDRRARLCRTLATPEFKHKYTWKDRVILAQIGLVRALTEEECSAQLTEQVHDDLDSISFSWKMGLFEKADGIAQQLQACLTEGVGSINANSQRTEVPINTCIPNGVTRIGGGTILAKLHALIALGATSPESARVQLILRNVEENISGL